MQNRIVINTPGIYRLSASFLGYWTPVNNAYGGMTLLVNGDEVLYAYESISLASGDNVNVHASGLFELAAGDYVSVAIFHTFGAARATSPLPPTRPRLSVELLR